MTEPVDGTCSFLGERLAYTLREGEGTAVVLLHGLLLDRRMHGRLAGTLAQGGHRVVTLDLLGHGGSTRPRATELTSIPSFAEQVVCLLDHLDIDRAVILGTSLGANVALETASQFPARVAGLVLEMPVLDNALVGAAAAFTPLLALLTAAPRAARLVTAPLRAVPRGGLRPVVAMGLDVLSQDPDGAARVLRGLLFGRTAPTHARRAAIDAPTLVIGHPRDPIHPLSDADMVAREIRGARLLQASSILELRLRPARLTSEIGRFVDGCNGRRRPAQRRRRAA